MILEFKQTKRAPKPEYEIINIKTKEVLGKVITPQDRLKVVSEFDILGHKGQFVLGDETNQENLSFKEKLQKALTFNVFEGKQFVGKIYGEVKDIKKFGVFGYGYQYQKIELFDLTF